MTKAELVEALLTAGPTTHLLDAALTVYLDIFENA